MNKAEKSGQRLAALIHNYPKAAKVTAWAIITALLGAGVWAAWNAIADGKIYKLLIPVAGAIWFGWRHYRQTKSAQPSESSSAIR